MNIGIDIRTLIDKQHSGIPEYTRNLVIEIIKRDKVNHYKLFYNSFHEVGDILSKYESFGAEIAPLRYPNKILNYLFFKTFNRPKIDKLLAVDLFFMPHLNFISLSHDVKKIITIHDLSFLRYPEYFNARKNLWHYLVNIRQFLRQFNLIVAVSQNTKNDIVELCRIKSDKIKVIYSGLGREYRRIPGPYFRVLNDSSLPIRNQRFEKNLYNTGADNFFKTGTKSGLQLKDSEPDEVRLLRVRQKYKLPKKFILYLGTLEPRKNISGLIKAYDRLRKMNNALADVKLVIAGAAGWKMKKIAEARQKSTHSRDIKFLGFVNSRDKVYLYNLARLFIYPSFYEGFGFPPLEAMACGTPVITGCASSMPEIGGGGAYIIDQFNIDQMAKAMELLLISDKLRHYYIKKGLDRSSQFNWEKTAQSYLEIFNNF